MMSHKTQDTSQKPPFQHAHFPVEKPTKFFLENILTLLHHKVALQNTE